MLPSPPAAVRVDVQRGVVSLMQQRGRGAERKGVRTTARENNITLTKAVTVRARMAETAEDLEAARHLVRRRYAWRGYIKSGPDDVPAALVPSAHELTFIAQLGDTTVGTITLGLDGPGGLLAESNHGEVIEQKRAEGRRVCELTKLAIAERADSRSVLASLFSLAYAAGSVHRVTDVFIEVSPRHMAFYTRVLGFVLASSEKICERVGVPSVLLWLEIEQLEQRLTELTRSFAGLRFRAAEAA
jgi:hypothetical protein